MDLGELRHHRHRINIKVSVILRVVAVTDNNSVIPPPLTEVVIMVLSSLLVAEMSCTATCPNSSISLHQWRTECKGAFLTTILTDPIILDSNSLCNLLRNNRCSNSSQTLSTLTSQCSSNHSIPDTTCLV